jgi:hypothetical protein
LAGFLIIFIVSYLLIDLPLPLSKKSEIKNKINGGKIMKKKIVGIFVCTLLIATAVPSALGATTKIIGKQDFSKNLENERVIPKNFYTLHEPEIKWEYLYGGPYSEVFREVIQTNDGGYITVGVWNSTSHWLVKFDADGQEEWNITALPNETLWPRCYTVEQTNDGGYVTAGSHEDASGIYGYNRCIWKVDEDGNTEWLKIYDDPLNGYHTDIEQTTDGGYIVCGKVDITSANHDVLLFKTNSTGEIEWQHIWGFGVRDDNAFAVRQTSDGGYILAGRTLYTGSNGDLLVIKTDSGGNMVWNKTYGGKYNEWTQANDILFANDGGYYFLGETNTYGAGSNDMWLVKTDANGVEQWNKTYGTKYYEMCGGFNFTDDGNIIFCGSTKCFNVALKSDGIVIKIDLDGNIIWQDTFGYADEDQLQDVFSTSDGSCIVAGNSVTTETSGYGEIDGWLIKMKNFVNNPPDKPSKPSGNKKGECKTSYIYKTSTSESDVDQIYYLWDWGDGNLSDWLGPYNSSEVCEANHSWEKVGTFSIRVMSKDCYERESEWSDSLPISIPRNKMSTNLFFLKLLERFPKVLPIMRYLLGL